MNFERHNHEVVYHFCARCGRRVPLAECDWQNGLLLCKRNDCFDKETIGERDAAIAKALQKPTKELQPDEKLLNPTTGGQIEDIII